MTEQSLTPSRMDAHQQASLRLSRAVLSVVFLKVYRDWEKSDPTWKSTSQGQDVLWQIWWHGTMSPLKDEEAINAHTRSLANYGDWGLPNIPPTN